jgi:hypothetical protein
MGRALIALASIASFVAALGGGFHSGGFFG